MTIKTSSRIQCSSLIKLTPLDFASNLEMLILNLPDHSTSPSTSWVMPKHTE